MAETTQTATLPQYQEDYLQRLLASAEAVAQPATFIPAQTVAPLSPGQQAAVQRGYQGVGGFQPFIEAGMATLGAGIGGYQQAGQALTGAAEQFDPGAQVGAFMDPYLENVVQQQYRDIERLGDLQRQQARGQAIGSGAFGGSRAAVQEAEVGRNVLEQQARTGAQLRSAGFSQALNAAQQAFENARNRQLTTAQTMGNLSQGLGAAGVQQAGLGQAFQQGQQADINTLLSLGGMEQQQAQNILEAQRATALQRQMEPYQRVGFLSDIFRGVPTASQTTQTTSAPGPSAISQIAGLGLGIAGLSQGLGGLGSLFKDGGSVRA